MLSVMGAMRKSRKGRGPDQGLDEEKSKVESCTPMTHRGKKKDWPGRGELFEAARLELAGLADSPRVSLAQVHPAKAALIALPVGAHAKA